MYDWSAQHDDKAIVNCCCKTTASARLWLYLKRLYVISSAIAYCISPYASFYAGLSCLLLRPTIWVHTGSLLSTATVGIEAPETDLSYAAILTCWVRIRSPLTLTYQRCLTCTQYVNTRQLTHPPSSTHRPRERKYSRPSYSSRRRRRPSCS